jgi:beta-lactam-binding protein with PASTA domain
LRQVPKVNTLSPGSLAVDGRWKTSRKDSAVSRARSVKEARQMRPRILRARLLVVAALLLHSHTAVDLSLAGSQALAAARPAILLTPLAFQQRSPGQEPPTQPLRSVPDILGRTEGTARQFLERAGLEVGTVTTRLSPATPGTVITQTPRAYSTVRAGSAVSFVLAGSEAETATLSVPDLVGRTFEEARAIVERLPLSEGAVRRQEAQETEGTVLAQQPGPGTVVVAGTAIDLTVAIPRTVALPDIVGYLESEARQILDRAELRVRTVKAVESRAQPDTVLSQTPVRGTRLEVGAEVDFAVATLMTVSVPDLVGRTPDAARRDLQVLELGLGAVTPQESRQPPGTVLSQAPAGGGRATVGSDVDVVVSTPITVLVPDLVGRTEAEARVLLAAAELVSGSATSRESRLPQGTVLVQSIQAGTQVEIGRDIGMTVAQPVTVLVPNLVGQDEGEAMSVLGTAELLSGDLTSRESRSPPGMVLAQSIPVGTRVEIGRSVDVTIARPVTVLVPDVVGRNEGEATRLLEGSELVAGDIQHQESAAQPGTVLAQSLNPGSRVEIGTAIPMLIAVVETVPVPNVVGLSLEAATQDLVLARLGVGSDVELMETRIEAENTVLQQSRQAGTVAAVGTPINLVIATPEMITVPNVVGLSDAEAVAAIVDVGLIVGALTEQLSLQAGGTVLAQGQAVNAQVVFYTPIALQVARPRAVWMVPGTLLLLFGMVVLLRVRKTRRADTAPPDERPTAPRETSDLAEVPQLRIRPEADDGTQRVEEPAQALTRLELRLRAVAEAGTQEVHANGDLIASERRAHE